MRLSGPVTREVCGRYVGDGLGVDVNDLLEQSDLPQFWSMSYLTLRREGSSLEVAIGAIAAKILYGNALSGMRRKCHELFFFFCSLSAATKLL